MAEPQDQLERFLEAQEGVYQSALAEIRGGRKQSHWMWFVFPQLVGLGQSSMARFYGIRDLGEAEAYLAHPVLGPRLETCSEALLHIHGKTAHDIFGTPDDLKLRSSMTLFSAVAGAGAIYSRVLDRYFGGDGDSRTLELLEGRS